MIGVMAPDPAESRIIGAWKYDPQLKVRYKSTWLGALQTFLGWTPEQVDAWSLGHEDDLNNAEPRSLFFHQPPLHYVAYLIIPEVFKDLDYSDFCQVKVAMMLAITQNGKSFPEAKDFDWMAAKSRVDRALSEHIRRLGLVDHSYQVESGGEDGSP